MTAPGVPFIGSRHRLRWVPMLSVKGSVHVAATPREVLELVCDLRAYMVFDTKMANVYECSPPDAEGNGHAVIRGLMRGIRSPKQRLAVRLDRWTSVTFTSAGPWLTDRLMWFQGAMAAEPFGGGSFITHNYRFQVKGPLGPLFDRYAHSWLDRDLHNELQRIKAHFDRRAAGLPPRQLPHRRPARTEEQRTRDKVRNWKDYRPPGWA